MIDPLFCFVFLDENILFFWMKSTIAITDGLCPQQSVTVLSSQSSLLQKAKEMPVLLTTTLEQDQRGKKAAPPHESKKGWDGQEEGLAVSIKQEFIESVD